MAPPITSSAPRTPEHARALEANVPAAPRRSASPPPLPAHVRTPPSGVRAAPSQASSAPRSTVPGAPAPPAAPDVGDMRPPLPSFRPRADSMDMTRVGAPNPMLLALARGGQPAPPRRLTWFLVGALVGGLVVWCATADVRADVYGARVWTADVLRSLRGVPASEGEAAPVPSPGASVDHAAESPPARAASPAAATSADPLPHAGPAAPAASPAANDVPTVDVNALPQMRAPEGPVAPATAETRPSPPDVPGAATAPALPNAPGPR